MFTAIMQVENGRIAKHAGFDTEQEALDHVARFQHHDPVEYEGDGVKESFAVPFKIKAPGDVKITLRDLAGSPVWKEFYIGVQTVDIPVIKVENTKTDEDGNESVTTTLTNVLQPGEFLRIERTLPVFPDAFVTTLPGPYIGMLKVGADKSITVDVPPERIEMAVRSRADKMVAEAAPPEKINQMLARAARLNAEHGIKGRPLTPAENSEVDQLITVDNYTNAVRNEAARYIAEDLPKLTEDQKLNFNPAAVQWPTL